jgi:D-serine deaminase-like pyridoxal phosphate-dependent protein
MAPDKALRLVVKSLPSLDLVAHIRARTGAARLMTFNVAMLTAFAKAMPDAHQLLGKPLPVRAARNFFARLPAECAEAAGRIAWLVDSAERLNQYAELASALGRPLDVVLEIDVGLHRGGFTGEDLGHALETLRTSTSLRYAGLMGYEPHIARMPKQGGLRDRALQSAWERYSQASNRARQTLGPDVFDGAIRNAGGSLTYKLYRDTDIANDISLGSAMLKPTDFDSDLLEDHLPAVFIATPAIKVLKGTQLPGVEPLAAAARIVDPNLAHTVFIHGGHWLAKPVDPPGLQYNKLFGRSSNQEMLNAGARLELAPDDFVFLRPTQSEAILLQFGDLVLYEAGEIVGAWPTLAPSA